jgi:hypothetical protein
MPHGQASSCGTWPRTKCAYHRTIRLPGSGTMGMVDVVIGRVLAIHIKDEMIRPDGRIDVLKIRPIARLGYRDYTSVESVFEIVIPGNKNLALAGMEGTTRF